MYTVSASDECGQSVSADLEFIVCDTWIPNVFTPGDNDLNERFEIDGLNAQSFPNSKLTIFNRWGNVVFEDPAYLNTWDGSDMNGNELSEGTYFYVFERSDGENFSGHLMIFRKK
jgi:gliding motility-associated-like protein